MLRREWVVDPGRWGDGAALLVALEAPGTNSEEIRKEARTMMMLNNNRIRERCPFFCAIFGEGERVKVTTKMDLRKLRTFITNTESGSGIAELEILEEASNQKDLHLRAWAMERPLYGSVEHYISLSNNVDGKTVHAIMFGVFWAMHCAQTILGLRHLNICTDTVWLTRLDVPVVARFAIPDKDRRFSITSLGSDISPMVKLRGFSCSTVDTTTDKSSIGNIAYLEPEAYMGPGSRKGSRGYASDSWAAGIMMLQLGATEWRVMSKGKMSRFADFHVHVLQFPYIYGAKSMIDAYEDFSEELCRTVFNSKRQKKGISRAVAKETAKIFLSICSLEAALDQDHEFPWKEYESLVARSMHPRVIDMYRNMIDHVSSYVSIGIEGLELLKGLLSLRPDYRPDFTEGLMHEYFDMPSLVERDNYSLWECPSGTLPTIQPSKDASKFGGYVNVNGSYMYSHARIAPLSSVGEVSDCDEFVVSGLHSSSFCNKEALSYMRSGLEKRTIK